MNREAENPAFLREQLITCLGNKRALLDFIGEGIARVKARTGKEKLTAFDAFSGSGVVSRYMKRHASFIYANDLEDYASVINRCYLTNRSSFPLREYDLAFAEISARLGNGPLEKGFISTMYAPADDGHIQKNERAFFTTRNARYIDTVLSLVAQTSEDLRPFFLAPLLSKISVHANTAGVFKGYYKDSATGIGRFGGRNDDALSRITRDIVLERPVLSNFECRFSVLKGDAASVCEAIPEVDVAYLDPPYNQHPYGSNYFMLNLVANNSEPKEVSRISGIPKDWKRSAYNGKNLAFSALSDLARKIKAKFILVSFNSEGFIAPGDMTTMLGCLGKVETLEMKYNAFRGSRNLSARPKHVCEYLFILEKK